QMRDTLDAHPKFTNCHPNRLAGEESPLTLARLHGTDDDKPQALSAALDPVGGWAPRFATRPLTRFEAKAQRAGRYIFYLANQRIKYQRAVTSACPFAAKIFRGTFQRRGVRPWPHGWEG